KPKDADTDPHLAKAGDSDAVAAWRARMGTDEAKDVYKDRAATAECVNAQPASVASSACGSVAPPRCATVPRKSNCSQSLRRVLGAIE
ncbi:MAG: hypothetical protein QG660_1252, partial [Pseudomonadota bacterium]|nr:hypothetical protein [Pseudomonadota bacterium]